ncbi:MAG: DUF2207 domain-containing protein [Acidobacteriota bacterium]
MRTARLVLLAVVALVIASAPVSGQRRLVIEDFHADVRVGADGVIVVTETIRPRFEGTWNGIFRTIPVDYTTPQGFTYTLRLDVDSVTDGDGSDLRYESSRERHYRKLKIWVPGAADARRTVVIRYRVANGLKFFEEHDELYWNVTGDEWEVPIEHAQAVIRLPPGVENIRTNAFTGGYGSRESQAIIGPAASTLERRIPGDDPVIVETSGPLSFREGLTVAVAWNPGVVARPTATQKARSFLADNWALGIPLFVFAGMFWVWRRHGRDPRRLPVAVQYEPPEGLTPAEVGTLADNSPDLRDITATIVDLAVRGFLRIEEKQEERFFGLFNATEYTLSLMKPAGEWTELRPHETHMLSNLFSTTHRGSAALPAQPIDSVDVSDLKNRFYKHVPTIKEHVVKGLIGHGYYRRRPDQIKRWFFLAAGIVAVLSIMASDILDLGGTGVIAGFLSAIVIAVFGWFMPARTIKGARALERVLGFEDFLDKVEGDRYERLKSTPHMFERYLPFAMALGVERNWAKAFDGIYTTQPAWYVGGHYPVFRAQAFTSSLHGLTQSAGSAMISAPRSSGGSGSGGGGFSGGGFGGGGGGGF